MPNNIYIGSRYVPLFDGDWINNKSYDPLTIVMYGNNSYTSKKPVPAGTLPTDTNYWAPTGNYNGQISYLQQQINDLSGRADVLDSVTEVAFFAGKKIVIIGDSLSDPSTMAPNWATLFKNHVESLGGTVDLSLCRNGDSFAGFYSSGSPTPYEKLLDYTDDVDIVIIALGINDYQGQLGIGYYNDNDPSSFVYHNQDYSYNSIAAQNKIMARIRQQMPHAIQYYCVPSRMGTPVNESKYLPISLYRYAFATVAQFYGARIIDWSSMPMFAPAANGSDFAGYTSSGDTLHPRNTYAPILMQYVKQQIMSGGANTWKDSADGFRIPVNATSLGSNDTSALVNIDSKGHGSFYYYAQCNFSGNYATLLDNIPLWWDGKPKMCMINGIASRIEHYGDSVIVYKPTGVTDANIIIINFDFLISNPMYDWEYIHD